MVENQCPVPYTEWFLAVSTLQCFVESFKSKTKSYFLNHSAREDGEKEWDGRVHFLSVLY